jgi:multicomponent Na+:H+ antiporter subunit E
MAGSVDVAWRALHPRLPISPSLEEYALHLPSEGPARVFFANIVSLLPGTLSTELRNGSMMIHVLSTEPVDAVTELRRLERKVGALFGLELPAALHASPE